MKSVVLLTVFLSVLWAQLAPSDAVSCYLCLPSDNDCNGVTFDTSKHSDWLKPCISGQTCLKTIHSDNTVTRACNNQAMCRDDTQTSYYESCFNNVCYEEYCCTGEGCNSAPVATSVGVLLTAFMVLATWVFRK